MKTFLRISKAKRNKRQNQKFTVGDLVRTAGECFRTVTQLIGPIKHLHQQELVFIQYQGIKYIVFLGDRKKPY